MKMYLLMRSNLFLSYAALVTLTFSLANSHIASYTEVWRQREKAARDAALEAYSENPLEVASNFNSHVHESLMNVTGRRLLHKYSGPCMATNPIDRCWRCNANWEQERKKLADCVLGFGRKTTGGRDGKIYVVTDASDNDLVNPKPGTLRYAVIQDEPLWIIFARDMIIRLNEELLVNSNKTIDGRGFNIHIANGAGIMMQFVKNIIIHNLHIHDIKAGNGGMIRDSPTHYGLRTKSDGDGVSIFGSTNIWVDHLSMSNCMDGLIDVIQGSTAITISNNHFTRHNEVMLMGATDGYSEDVIMQVTVAFNHFGRGLVQRMPRCRWGFFHVVNNDYTHWIMYAVGGSMHPTIISQGNRYTAPHNIFTKQVTKREYAPEKVWKDWIWRSEGDLMLNGAFFIESGETKERQQFSRYDMIKSKPGTFVTRLTRFSGTLGCKSGIPC